MRLKAVLYSILLLFVFAQCTDDCECEDTKFGKVRLTYHILNNGQEVQLTDKFSFVSMNEMMLEKLKFYLSNVSARQSTGIDVSIREFELIDFESSELISFSYDIPIGDYTSLSFGMGLDSLQNKSDPNSFDIDHPLSAGQGMYWSWAMKYRFVILEGRSNKLDTIGQPSDVIMAYHPGANSLYYTYQKPVSFSIAESKTSSIDVFIELENVFDGPGGIIDIPTENQSHTTPDDYNIAQKFIINLGNAIEFQ